MSSPAKLSGEIPRRWLFESAGDLTGRTPEGTVDSDVVIILAALLCTVICIVGLGFMLRCACRCRWVFRSDAGAGHSPADLASSANKGLKKKTLKALPKTVYGHGEPAGKSSECAICLTEFVSGEELRVLPQCGHCFHVKCVDTWLGSHSSCPSCRQVLVDRGGLPGSRCQRCGLESGALPASSAGDGGHGRLREQELKSSEDHVLRFLP